MVAIFVGRVERRRPGRRHLPSFVGGIETPPEGPPPPPPLGYYPAPLGPILGPYKEPSSITARWIFLMLPCIKADFSKASRQTGRPPGIKGNKGAFMSLRVNLGRTPVSPARPDDVQMKQKFIPKRAGEARVRPEGPPSPGCLFTVEATNAAERRPWHFLNHIPPPRPPVSEDKHGGIYGPRYRGDETVRNLY